MRRTAELERFLTESAVALRAACHGAALRVAETVIARFGAVGDGSAAAARLPACDWIAPALAGQQSGLALAFAAVEGKLAWTRRASARPDERFWDGHANAVILGPGGFEVRSDLWIGATVMAPGVVYPQHDHAPEEVYLPLTAGEWWNAAMDWTDPGPAGCIYNPPGIAHAMRSGEGPFLALWYLPL